MGTENEDRGPSDISIISKFFFDGTTKATEKLAEMKKLTPQDKAQLAEGIRNGSLTY